MGTRNGKWGRGCEGRGRGCTAVYQTSDVPPRSAYTSLLLTHVLSSARKVRWSLRHTQPHECSVLSLSAWRLSHQACFCCLSLHRTVGSKILNSSGAFGDGARITLKLVRGALKTTLGMKINMKKVILQDPADDPLSIGLVIIPDGSPWFPRAANKLSLNPNRSTSCCTNMQHTCWRKCARRTDFLDSDLSSKTRDPILKNVAFFSAIQRTQY